MRAYKYISENTAGLLYLHDCDCSRMYFSGDRIVLEMEWMEVLAEHPHNNFFCAHQSGEGTIELLAPQVIRCEYENGGKSCSSNDLSCFSFENLEFLVFDEKKTADGYECEMFLIKADNSGRFDNVSIVLKYRSSLVGFDDLGDESWFESRVDLKSNCKES